MSALQGFERARLDVSRENARLSDAAGTVASDAESVFESGAQLLRNLGRAQDVLDVTPFCDRVLSEAIIGLPAFSNLSRLNSDGVVVCAVLSKAKGLNAQSDPLFNAARIAPDVVVSGELISKVTHRPVIGGMRAIRDSTGRFKGALGFALDVYWFDSLLINRHLPAGAAVAIFDRTRKLVATNNLAVSHALAGVSLTSESHGDHNSISDVNGTDWAYSIAHLRGSHMFVVTALPEEGVLSPTYISALMDVALPIFMIALSWVAIWYAAEKQITTWIVYLKRIVATYGGGHYSVRPSLEGAPGEFLLLGDAVSEMADAILDRDRRLREALTQKSLLIKEIHHRVKNNLQIVMSLLRLQAEQLKDSPLRLALSHAQARINALALVHRILHEVDDQTTIDLERLVTELTAQVEEDMGQSHIRIEVKTDLARRNVPGELAVPIALFAVEAISNALRHAFPMTDSPGMIHVDLQSTPTGQIRLKIEDNGFGFDSEATHSNIGLRLLRAFAQQLDGTASVVSQPGRGTVVTLVIADPASLTGSKTGEIAA